ncbi:MAG: hypothetical protein L3J59_05870 [Methylococcaceae bacterium]|nr:hypothetical protein [Methylococcaceae bacterium]
MKRNTILINLFIIFLFASPFSSAIETPTEKNKNKPTSSDKIIITSNDNKNPEKLKINDSFDSTTSASKLRARKSHAVSKEDETGLAIFFGIIILGVIIFFLKPFREQK